MQLTYKMTFLRMNNMTFEEFCLMIKKFADKLACASNPVTKKDLLMQILNGLGPNYLDLT